MSGEAGAQAAKEIPAFVAARSVPKVSGIYRERESSMGKCAKKVESGIHLTCIAAVNNPK